MEDTEEIKEIIMEQPPELKEEKKSGGVFGFMRKKTKTKERAEEIDQPIDSAQVKLQIPNLRNLKS